MCLLVQARAARVLVARSCCRMVRMSCRHSIGILESGSICLGRKEERKEEGGVWQRDLKRETKGRYRGVKKENKG